MFRNSFRSSFPSVEPNRRLSIGWRIGVCFSYLRHLAAATERRQDAADTTAIHRPILSSVTGCLLTLLLISGCSTAAPVASENESVAAAAPSAPPPALVRVQPVRYEEIAARLIAVGTVRPRHSSIIASAADGVVDEFNVEEGDFVKADTILSQLRMFSTNLSIDEQRAVLAEREAMHQQMLTPRQEDVDEAKAQQLASEASLENADRRFRELQSLLKRGATNQSDVDNAQQILAEAKNRAVAATAVFDRVAAGTRAEEKLQTKARLDAQTTHVAWLEAEKEKRTTRAPFDGFILSEDTYLGQWLSKGAPVVTMAMLDDVDVEVPVDQSFISQVIPGTKVRLKINGTTDPSSADGRWTGTVLSIVSRSEWKTGSRSFPVIVRVKNQIQTTSGTPVPTLREGMMAEVEFFGTAMQAKMVPKDSLVRTSRGTFVFAVNPPEDGKPLSVSQFLVEPGLSEANSIQVQSEDLQADMQVVTEGAERLRPFQTVTIIADAG